MLEQVEGCVKACRGVLESPVFVVRSFRYPCCFCESDKQEASARYQACEDIRMGRLALEELPPLLCMDLYSTQADVDFVVFVNTLSTLTTFGAFSPVLIA